MQTAAKEALDISQEPEAIQKTLRPRQDATTSRVRQRCLIARRLVERGVRFVQMFLGGQPWDTHTNHPHRLAAASAGGPTSRPRPWCNDLKQRGLLDTTIVHWGGEIGRLPVWRRRA